MNLDYLKKLELIIKTADYKARLKSGVSKNYKIIFSLNGEVYTGEFFYDSFEDKAQYLEWSSTNQFKDIYVTFKEFTNNNRLFSSDEIETLATQSKNITEPSEYLKLIETLFDINKLELNNKVPNYLVKVKCLSNNLPITSLKLDENVNFDFVSLISEDKLNN